VIGTARGSSDKYKDIDVEVVRSDYQYIIKYLEEALEILNKEKLTSEDKRKLKKLIKRVLRRAHASLIGLVKDRSNRTILVDHIVANKRGVIKHYGIHGLRGYDPSKPDEVQFRNKHGEPVEYEEYGEKIVRRKGRMYKRKARTRRVKKAG